MTEENAQVDYYRERLRLCKACKSGNLTRIKELIKKIGVHYIFHTEFDEFDRTPLEYAIENDQVQICEYLLICDTEKVAFNLCYGSSNPLLLAAIKENREIIKLLFAHGFTVAHLFDLNKHMTNLFFNDGTLSKCLKFIVEVMGLNDNDVYCSTSPNNADSESKYFT